MATVEEIKQKVLKAAKGIDMMSLAAMPRHERRRIAKANGIKNLLGTNTPYINHAKRKRREEKEARAAQNDGNAAQQKERAGQSA